MISPNLNNGYGSSIYFTGRNIRNAQITGVTPTGSGLTRLAGIDLSAAQVLDSVDFDEEVELVEVSSANALMKNYVAKKGDFTATLSEYINSLGCPNVLYSFKNYTYVLIEVAIEQTAPVLYAANGGPLPFETSLGDGTIIQCPCILGATRYGYSENQEVATVTGRPMGLPIVVVPAGSSLFYP